MEEKSEFVSGERALLRLFKRDVYMRPVLSREDEAVIAQRARAGDQEATDLLIESNLRFVLKTVFQHWRPGRPLLDMISEGCLAMVIASRLFDPGQDVRFITYAGPGVIQRVRECIRVHYRHSHDSLDEPAFEDNDETTQKDLLTSSDPGADEAVFNRQIRTVLADLDDRERRVLILRFWCDCTFDQTAGKIGVTPERIRQIERRALRKLRWTRGADLGGERRETAMLGDFAGCKA